MLRGEQTHMAQQDRAHLLGTKVGSVILGTGLGDLNVSSAMLPDVCAVCCATKHTLVFLPSFLPSFLPCFLACFSGGGGNRPGRHAVCTANTAELHGRGEAHHLHGRVAVLERIEAVPVNVCISPLATIHPYKPRT